MKKFIGFLIIMLFIISGCFLVALVAGLGLAILWAAFHYSEVVNLIMYGKGAEVAEKVTGEKYTR